MLLAVTLLPSTPSVRRGRLGDVAETIALLSLLPLLVLATGVFGAIRELIATDGDQEGPRRGLLVQPAPAGHGVRLRRARRPRGGAAPGPAAPSSAALALAVLLIAGAAIAGVFTQEDPDDWEEPACSSPRTPAAIYVIIDGPSAPTPVLRPIINITSAKLILGSDVEPKVIPEEIAESEIGSDLGIFGAPATCPTSRG